MNAAPRDTTSERLLDLQLSFNLYPSQYAHTSWLERLGVSDADKELRTSPLWIRSVSSALLRGANLDKHFDNDFFDPAKRLALHRCVDTDASRRPGVRDVASRTNQTRCAARRGPCAASKHRRRSACIRGAVRRIAPDGGSAVCERPVARAGGVAEGGGTANVRLHCPLTQSA